MLFWQTSLILAKALDTVNAYLQNKTLENCNLNKKSLRTTVVLLMVTSASLNENDKINAEIVIKSIKQLYPETRMVYVTSDQTFNIYNIFKKLYSNDIIIKTSKNDKVMLLETLEKLAEIPSRIIEFYCNATQFHVEDYITPGANKLYEIHADYMQRSGFLVKFKGNHYGEASICAYDSEKAQDKECKGLSGNEEVEFNAWKYCSQKYACNVQFSVNVVKTEFKCIEFDCRYPDQMRLDISTSRTRKSGSSAICCNLYMFVVLVLLGLRTLF